MKFKIMLVLGIVSAVALGYTDLYLTELPITMALVVVFCFAFGFIANSKAWMWGLFVSVGVPIGSLLATYFGWQFWDIVNNELIFWKITYNETLLSCLSLVAGLAGSLSGAGVRRITGLHKVTLETQTSDQINKV